MATNDKRRRLEHLEAQRQPEAETIVITGMTSLLRAMENLPEREEPWRWDRLAPESRQGMVAMVIAGDAVDLAKDGCNAATIVAELGIPMEAARLAAEGGSNEAVREALMAEAGTKTR